VLLSVWHQLSDVDTRKAWEKFRLLARSSEFFLIPLALATGVTAGGAVTLMSEIAQIAHVVIYGIAIDVRLSANATVNPVIALAAPMLGGLLLGGMEWYRRKWKISQAVDPIEANALRGGQLSMRDSIIVSSQTMISNGCGASVGLEAGYTQIGAGIASFLDRKLRLRRNDLRLLVGCGAAGAIAAAFGAPITGAFYACELIVGIYSVGSAAPILAAAISAALTARWLGGASYVIEVPKLAAVTGEQYFVLIALALVVGAVGICIMRLAAVFEGIFNQSWIPSWIRPAIGGLCVGGLAIITPQALAAGHGAMLTDLHTSMTASFILAIIAIKIVACLTSLASGFRGGLFFASLFIGCLIGKLFAVLLPVAFPAFPIDPTTSMLTGVATLGVAIVGGPLTMSFLVLETTRNLEVTAGVLAACMATSVLVRALFGHSFSTWRLHLRGETIRSASGVVWIRNLSVGLMMRTDVAIVHELSTVADCRRDFPLGSRKAVFVADADGNYRGVVMLPDIFSSVHDFETNLTPVTQVMAHGDHFLYRSHDVDSAMKAFDQASAEVLAVIESPTSAKIVGYLTEAYARRRYAEELDQATRGILGHRG
jgi:CIC family chloride channel protein